MSEQILNDKYTIKNLLYFGLSEKENDNDFKIIQNELPVNLDKDKILSLLNLIKVRLVIGVRINQENMFAFTETLESIKTEIQKLEVLGINHDNILIIMIADGYDNLNSELKKDLKINDEINPRESFNIQRNFENDINIKTHYFLQYNYNIREIFEQEKIINSEGLNFILSIKECSRGKLDSTFLLLCKYSKLIENDFLIILDCGMKLKDKSLFYLIQPMINYQQISGVYGEIDINYNSCFDLIKNSQIFEYKSIHYINKRIDSLFGISTSSPGGFIAYRTESFIKFDNLQQEIKSFLPQDDKKINCNYGNLYLAENKIINNILFMNNLSDNIIKFNSIAICEIKTSNGVTNFISSQRQIINGDFFGILYILKNFCKIWKSNHSILRKFSFLIFILFTLIEYIYSFFILGNYYFILQYLFNQVVRYNYQNINISQTSAGDVIVSIFLYLIFLTIIICLSIKGERAKTYYRFLLTVYSLYYILAVVLLIISLKDNFKETFQNQPLAVVDKINFQFIWVIVSIALSFFMYFFMLILNCNDFLSLVGCSIFYFFFHPGLNLFTTIFSFCNVDDVSWGNENDRKNNVDFKIYKTNFLVIWIFFNFVYGWGFYYLIQTKVNVIFINIFCLIISAVLSYKIFFSTIEKLKYCIFDKHKMNKTKKLD